MTLEQFDEAKELINEIDLVAQTQWLFGNWSSAGYRLVLKDSEHHVVNTVHGLSVELKDRLLDVCIQYEKELRDKFDKM